MFLSVESNTLSKRRTWTGSENEQSREHGTRTDLLTVAYVQFSSDRMRLRVPSRAARCFTVRGRAMSRAAKCQQPVQRRVRRKHGRILMRSSRQNVPLGRVGIAYLSSSLSQPRRGRPVLTTENLRRVNGCERNCAAKLSRLPTSDESFPKFERACSRRPARTRTRSHGL